MRISPQELLHRPIHCNAFVHKIGCGKRMVRVGPPTKQDRYTDKQERESPLHSSSRKLCPERTGSHPTTRSAESVLNRKIASTSLGCFSPIARGSCSR